MRYLIGPGRSMTTYTGVRVVNGSDLWWRLFIRPAYRIGKPKNFILPDEHQEREPGLHVFNDSEQLHRVSHHPSKKAGKPRSAR